VTKDVADLEGSELFGVLLMSVLLTGSAWVMSALYANGHGFFGTVFLLVTAVIALAVVLMLRDDDWKLRRLRGTAEMRRYVVAWLVATTLPLAATVWVIAAHEQRVAELDRAVARECKSLQRSATARVGERYFNLGSSWAAKEPDLDEYQAAIEDACPEDAAAANERSSSSSEPAGSGAPRSQWSDCDQRIYAVTHSGLFTDEEENEMIRAINQDCGR
jgi:hypothetical protein